VRGDLAQHAQVEADVVDEIAKEVLQANPQAPNTFVENANLPILDPARITVPTMIIMEKWRERLCGERGRPAAHLLAT
jgi:hypothetical protein